MSDWKNSSNFLHSLFHKDLYEKLQKLKECLENLCIHLLYIWSDGFQKNTLVKTKNHLCNFFIVYVVTPDGVQDIARYTIPFSLGIKQKDHQRQLIEILQQTKDLEKVISRYWGLTICTLPETVIIQREYKLYTFFHVFLMYSVHLSTDFTYSHVPGDQGGPIFIRLMNFFGGRFTYKLVYYNLYLGYKFVSKHVQIYSKLYVTNVHVTNLYYFCYILIYINLKDIRYIKQYRDL